MIDKKYKENQKKKIVIIGIIIVSIIAITITIVYYNNKIFKEWVDKEILRKEVIQDKVNSIEIKENPEGNICAFNKYIGVLNKNKFKIYGNTGSEEKSLEIQISNPIFDSASKYLAIAEKNGKKVYLISDQDIIWETEVEGNISQVQVNKNGYVAVVLTNASYKTIINMYKPEEKGKEMFKTFLSSTRTADISISNDNKYLAVAEVDTLGSIIQSSIKIISIEKASTDPTNSLENTYKSEQDKLLTNIEYQDKNKLVCMYTDSIHIIENNQDQTLIDKEKRKMMFQSIELSNNAIVVEEKSSGLFTADSVVNIMNTEHNASKEYTVNSVVKEIYTYGDIIALNLGMEVEFINTEGWLVKRYISKQEINKVVVSNNIAGIIYRDRIEIINL